MVYDETIAIRIRQALAGQKGISELRMMGGLCFLLHGNMLCGVEKSELVVRVGPERHTELLSQPHARPMDFTGRPLKGFLYISAAGFQTASQLKKWLQHSTEFASSLPKKRKKQRRKK